MRRGPENSRRVHQVAVILNGDRQPAVLLVSQRGAERGRRAVADAESSGRSDVLVKLVKIPQAQRPAIHPR